MGRGPRGQTGRGRGKGGETSHHPHPLISVPATFLSLSAHLQQRFLRFRLPYTSRPVFYPGCKLCPPPFPPLLPKGEKRKKEKKKERKKKERGIK